MSFLQNKKVPSSEDQLTIESNTNDRASNNGKSIEKDNVDSSQREEEVSKFLLVHGGMDTEGNVFDDLFFINLE
jgi:hypothetical protein